MVEDRMMERRGSFMVVFRYALAMKRGQCNGKRKRRITFLYFWTIPVFKKHINKSHV